MPADSDSLRDEVTQLRQTTDRLQQELDAVKRLLGLGVESAVKRKRLGTLGVEGVFVYPHEGDHLDHSDLQLLVTEHGGMIKFRSGPMHPLMTLLCDENGGHIELHGRKSLKAGVKLWIQEDSGRVGVTAKGHRGAAGLHVQPTGGVVVVQAADGKTRGFLRVAETGGELYVIGNDDRARVMLWQEETGGAVTIIGKGEQGKADMRILPGVGGALAVSTLQNNPVFMASAGTPAGNVSLMNEQGEFVVLLWADAHGGNIDSWSHDGKTKVRLGTHEVGGSVEIERSNRTLARLGIDPDGGSLGLYDPAGDFVVRASSGPQGGQLLMRGHGRQHGILLGIASHGPALELSRGDWAVQPSPGDETAEPSDDDGAQSHVQLHTTDHGGMIRVMGNDGHCRAAMTVGDEGGQFVVFNDDRKIQASMHTQPHGGVVTTYGFTGQPRAGMCSDEEGGRINVWDNRNRSKAGMVATKDGAQLGLSDGDAKRILIAFDPERNFIGIFNNDADPGVLLVVNPDGGLIEVFDTDGGVKSSLPM